MRRDRELLVASIDWTYVLVALITTVPGTIAAAASLSNRRHLRTPSGTTIGKQVENVQHTALSNYYRLHSLTKGLDVKVPIQAEQEDEKIEGVQDRRERDGH